MTATKAHALRALHVPGRPLIAPNVWDAATAAIVATAGFPAIATSSAAVAESLGYRDGGHTPPGEVFGAIRRISAACELPVTADIERGYGLPPAELTAHLLAAGAVGCNIEDSEPGGGLIDPSQQAEFIGAMRRAADRSGVPLVINARIDVFIKGNGRQMSHVDEAVTRGRLYFEAGADCVFPILASEPEVIRELADRIGGPVNVLRTSGLAHADLAALGVARISYGASLFREAMSQFTSAVRSIG